MTSKKTILTIDDDYAITELLSIILRSHGFEVLTANNSQDGLRIIAEESPDAITLDLMMPDVSGLEMCKKIRAISTIPILVLFGHQRSGHGCQRTGCGRGRFHRQASTEHSVDCAREYVTAAFETEPGNLKQPENVKWLQGTCAATFIKS